MIERIARVFFSFFFALSVIPALAQDTVPEIAESHGRIRRFRLLPPDEESPLDARQPKPEEILRWSLEMVHPEELDYAAMAKALAQQNGWTTNRVLDNYMGVACNPAETETIRKRAVFAYSKIVDEEWRNRLSPWFDESDDPIRRYALSLTLGNLPDERSRLDFFRDQIDRRIGVQTFRHDIYTLAGRFHGVVEYRFGTPEDREEILSFFHRLAEAPLFAECADVADDFLSRFDPDWPRCNARKLLLAKWKDDPSLSDFARNRMREAFSALESSEKRPDSDAEAFHDPVKPDSLAVDASSTSIKDNSASSPSGKGVVVRSRFIHVLSGICVLMAGIFIGTLVRILSRSRHK